jgi:hypothetical protein
MHIETLMSVILPQFGFRRIDEKESAYFGGESMDLKGAGTYN